MDYTVFNKMVTNDGKNLESLSKEGPVLLVFLRHFGCIFCREAMLDMSEKRNLYESKNIKIVFVHMSDNETADSYFTQFKIKGISHISDPQKEYYAAFGLARGKVSQLLGLQNLLRGIDVLATKDVPFTLKTVGDGFQMPGVFVVNNNKIVSSFIHRSASDRPDYDGLLSSFL